MPEFNGVSELLEKFKPKIYVDRAYKVFRLQPDGALLNLFTQTPMPVGRWVHWRERGVRWRTCNRVLQFPCGAYIRAGFHSCVKPMDAVRLADQFKIYHAVVRTVRLGNVNSNISDMNMSVWIAEELLIEP